MASSIEADVTCPVCLELFNQPVLLRCLHTLCTSCSTLVEAQPMKIQCPTCREVTDRSDVIHDFKTQNWVDLYKQLKAKEEIQTPTAPPQVSAESSLNSCENENIQSTTSTDKEIEAMGEASTSKLSPIGYNVESTGASLYPRLSPPPPYSSAISLPIPPQVMPVEPIDQKSLRNFQNVDLHHEDVFKFRDKPKSLSLIQDKIWVVLNDGTIKIFKKTGYQFGKYITSDVEVYQQTSNLWSVLQWKDGADKYVYKVTAVAEAHNGDIIASCSGCTNSWAFDSVGLVHINNIGQVLASISNKHYSDVTCDDKHIYAQPIEARKSQRIEIYHHDGHKWLLQRKIIVENDMTKLCIGHNILFTCNAPKDLSAINKYDLMGKSEATGKHSKYARDVLENVDRLKLLLCCVDHHGNCLVADNTNNRLILVTRAEQWLPLRIVGKAHAHTKPFGVVMQDATCLVTLTVNEAGVAKLVQIYKA